ncbi:autotransporter domain-containing protein [Achromobacter ruhlandii]|uniref:autotransporter domain-containing protein n=1 Tax=Achromobacter ruhlandii TaxID=72557 RepID=UPI0023B0100E|nr:autotransporter domain-containing protein [Achromobacter ruhlandii]
MRPTLPPLLRLSALSLAIAVCFTAPTGAQAQQILRAGGNGGGISGSISGQGGIAGGGGGGGGYLFNKGGDAQQTLTGGAQAGNGLGPGGGMGAWSGVAGGGGGGGDNDNNLGGDGGEGNLTTQAYYRLFTNLRGGSGGSALSDSGAAAGGGGGGAGLVVLSQNGMIETAGAFVIGGDGGTSETGNPNHRINGGGGGAGLVLARGGEVRVTGNSRIIGGRGGDSFFMFTRAGDGGAGVFLYDGGTLAISSGAGVQGGDAGGGGSFAGVAAAGVLSNLGNVVNAGAIAGGAGRLSFQNVAGAGGAGIEAWGGTIRNDATAQISGGMGGTTDSASPTSVTGAGGAGIVFRNGQAASLVNAGKIYGGIGGLVPLNARIAGPGGVGITGAGSGNISIVNSGEIAGGLSSDQRRTNAIELFGSGNRLELQPGGSIIGNVVVAAGGADNVLALGGDIGTGLFDVTRIGADQAYRGFDRFEKTGAGTWILSGPGTQDWLVKQGTLGGNTQSIGGNVRFADASNATLILDQGTHGVYAGTISGAGALTKKGAAVLTLTGSNSYTGGTSVLDGTLALSTRDPAGSVQGAIDTSARLELYNTSAGISRITIASGTGSAHFYSDANASNARLVNDNLLGFYDISSAGRASVLNNGNMFFFADSTAGQARISNTGRLNFLGHADGGTATLINAPGATIDFSQSAGAAGDGKLSVGVLTGDGTVFLGNNELTIHGGSGGFDFTGVIADGGSAGTTGASLVKAGDDTMTLRGRNTYTGPTTVRSGMLVAGGADVLRSSSALKVESAGTFSIGGFNVTVGALSGAGLITNTGGVLRTLTVDSAQDSTFSGRLADSQSASLSLQKQGSGTLILSGSNTFNGAERGELAATQIFGGTLQFGDGSGSVNRLGGTLEVYEGGALSIAAGTTVNVARTVNLINLGFGVGAVLSIAANADGPSLTADRVNIDLRSRLNLSGIQGAIAQDQLLIDTRSGIFGDFARVNIGGFAGPVDYLSVSTRKSADGLQYFATYGLNWSANTSLSHGTFTLADADNRFTVNADLTDQAANPVTGWDGTSLSKAGAGTLVLSGNNTYTGGTTIGGGTLQLGDGGNSGSIQGDVHNLGTLAFNRGDTMTFSGNISGTGAVRQIGAGTTLLTGANRHTGGTIVENGTLRAGSATAFAPGTAYTINGGTLDLNDHDLTMSALSGSGGTVALGAATLTIDQSTDSAYAGAFSGSGELVKLGTGTLTLTGPSTLSLRLGSGALVTSAEGLGGDAVLAAGTSLAFNQVTSATYGGRLSGAGDLRKTGAGKLELSGDSSGFTGTTTLQAGILAVNGRLGGALEVGAAGRLQGNGSVGNTTVNGTVAPGNSIGTLNVAGNLVFNPGSIYEVEVNPAGQSDRILATGSATLNGGTVQVHAGVGDYARSNRYTILSANGGRTGTFGGVTSNLAFLSPSLEYDANNAYLTLTRNTVGFEEAGTTGNQTGAGGAAGGLGPGNPLHDAILGLSAAQARGAFDQLSGEVYASVRTALIEDSRYLRDAVNARLRTGFNDDGQSGDGLSRGVPSPVAAAVYENGQPRAITPGTDRVSLWSQAFGAWARTNSQGNAARLTRSTGGFLAGADAPVSRHWRLGATAGYSRTGFDVKDRLSSGSSDNYHLGLYAGAVWGNLALRAGASHTWHDLSARREAAFPGFSDRLKSGYRAGTSQVFGELGYRIQAGRATFEPYANLAHVSLRTRGYTEQGGAAALAAAASTTDTTFTTLGLRAARSFDLQGSTLTVRGMAGWRHTIGDLSPQAMLRFAAGGGGYTVNGVPLARNSAAIEAGLDYAASVNTTLGLAYNGQLGGNQGDHALKATLNLRF